MEAKRVGAYGHALDGAQGGQSLHSDQAFVGIPGEEFLAGHKRWSIVKKGLRNFPTQTPKQEWKTDRSRQPCAYRGCHGGVLRGSFWPGDRLLPLHSNGYTTLHSRTVQVFSNIGITKGAS